MAPISIPTLHKFVDKKIENKFNSLRTLADFIDELDSIIDIMNRSNKHRQEFRDTMISICIQKKRELEKLYKKREFLHLSAKEVYKLMQFKEKINHNSLKAIV